MGLLLMLLPLIAGIAVAAPVEDPSALPSFDPASQSFFKTEATNPEKSALESGYQYFAVVYNAIYSYQRGAWRSWDADYWVEWSFGRHVWGYDRNTLHFDTSAAVTYSSIDGVWDYHYMPGSSYGGGIVGFARDEVYTVGRNSSNSFLYRFEDVAGSDDWHVVTDLGNYAVTELWGLAPESLFIGGFDGAFLHWDGSAVHELSLGVYGRVMSMWGTSAGNIYLVTEGDGLLHWDGAELAPVAVPAGFNASDVRAVWGSGPDSVWAVGVEGSVLYFDGTAWVDQSIEGVTANLIGVHGSGPNEVLAVGANSIYKYDGTEWALYDGINSGEVYFSTIWGTYAEDEDRYWDGRFSDGQEDGGLGLSSTVRGIHPWESGVVVGGSFAYAGPDTANYVALLEGDTYTPYYASSGPNSTVLDFIEYDGQLIMSGSFNIVDGDTIVGVAAWDGSAWNRLGDGIPDVSNTGFYDAWRMTIWNDNLVVVGAPEVTAMWDGDTWTKLEGFTGRLMDVAVYDGDLYAAGAVASPGTGVVRYNGTTWEQVGNNGFTSQIYAMEVYDDHLYIGGDFVMDGTGYNKLARWGGVSWSTIGTVTGSYVVDLGVYDGSLWVGGQFSQIEGEDILGGAFWNETDGWRTLGSGVDSWSWTNAVDQDGALWIGGGFNAAGNKESRRIARWQEMPAALDGAPTTVGEPAVPGEDYRLAVNITGEVGDRPVVVRYRGRDSDSYQGARMYPAATKDGVFEGIIPGSYIEDLGFQYYITGGDEGAEFVFPEGDPEDPGYAPAWTGVTMSNFQFTPPAAQTYTMMGIPFVPNGSQGGILQGSMGQYDRSQWRFGRWNPTTSSYVEFPDTPDFAPGLGYWLIQRNPRTLTVNGVSTNTFGGVNVQIRPGWNMISTPYAFPILWSDVTLDTDIEDRLVARSGGTYVDVTVMNPWQGYWVLNTGLNDRVINIPPIEAPLKALTDPLAVTSQALPDGAVWAINVSAARGDRSDIQNIAAVAAGAEDGVDRMDYHEPPALPGDVSLSFLVDHGDRTHHLSTDTRAEFTGGQAWDAELKCEGGGRVELTFTGVDQVPAEFEVALITAAGRIDLRAADTAAVTVGESGSATLRLAVGDVQYVAEQEQNLPRPFALRPNYPNPFNPRTKISFTLPYASRVLVDIYDLRGRKVRTLVDGDYTAGLHEIDWLGKDDGGRSVSTGVYFSRMQADGFEQVRKMTLVR